MSWTPPIMAPEQRWSRSWMVLSTTCLSLPIPSSQQAGLQHLRRGAPRHQACALIKAIPHDCFHVLAYHKPLLLPTHFSSNPCPNVKSDRAAHMVLHYCFATSPAPPTLLWTLSPVTLSSLSGPTTSCPLSPRNRFGRARSQHRLNPGRTTDYRGNNISCITLDTSQAPKPSRHYAPVWHCFIADK